MLRATACTLLVASFCTGSFAGQRGSMGSRGAPAGHSGISGPRTFRGSISQRPFAGTHTHHNRAGSFFYPYLFPYDEPYAYEEPYTQVEQTQPAPIMQPPAVPLPPPEPKLIEVPAAAHASPAKPLPPAIFILTSGERLETSRFLLRANDLSVTIDRRQRTIPLDQLNLDATLAANRERGINLEIPVDPNEISLRF